MRHRSNLVKRRSASMLRIEALVELMGPALSEVLGDGDLNKTARLDFAELAEDIAAEARLLRQLNSEIAAIEDRIEAHDEADPAGIVISAPGVGPTLAAGILGRTGDLRFDNLAGVRASTGLVPKVDQSGTADRHGGPTKAGDPGLREALYLAADLARKVDPTLAARYRRLVVDEGKHHSSALCSIAPVLMTRIARVLAQRAALRAAGYLGERRRLTKRDPLLSLRSRPPG